MPDASLLIGDIGGTNARFALADKEASGYSQEQVLKCSDFVTASDAIKHYLDTIGAPTPSTVCLAAAGPIVDQEVQFTNNSWTMSAGDLRQVFDSDSVQLLNDFEAIAYSVPLLSREHLHQIGVPTGKTLTGENFTIGVVGPGTGLGTAGLRKFGDHLIPIVSEAGHIGFAPETQVQLDLQKAVRGRFDRVSAERLVSGPGLENLYWAFCRIYGEQRRALSAAEIFSESSDGDDHIASEAVDTFFEILGQVAGDFALALGASDGIFIAGGIARRYPERLASSRFRSGFEGKGRHRTIMESIPTQLIMHEHPGLLGAAYCARELATSSQR